MAELSLCAQVMPAILAKGLSCTTSASAYLLVMMCHKEVHCGGADKIYGKTIPAIKALLQMLHRQWTFLTTRMSRSYMFSDIKLGNILRDRCRESQGSFSELFVHATCFICRHRKLSSSSNSKTSCLAPTSALIFRTSF